MKKIALLLFALTLTLGACGSKTAGDAAVNLVGSLIPANASVIGSVDVPGLLKLDIAKTMTKETADFEKETGIKIQDFGTVTFWAIVSGDDDPEVAFFTKGVSISVIEKLGKKSQDYQGVQMYMLNDDDAVAASIADQLVIGTAKAVKSSIDASKGKNLVSAGRDKQFSTLMGKASGLIAVAFVPDAKTKADIVAKAKDLGEMADFVKDFKGLALGLGFASSAYEIRLAAESTKDAASSAADMITKMVDGYKSQVDGFAMMLGKEAAGSAKKAFDSFTAKASGSFLNIGLDLPEALITALTSNMGALFGGMPGGMMD